MKKVLVTGGAGFIGNYIVNYLSKQNEYDITVLDCFSPQIHGESFLDSYLYKGIAGKVKLIKGDVRNREDLKKALEGIEYIIHLAAETGTGQSMYELNRYTDVNIMGTSNLFDIIVNEKLKIKKIILSSSRSIYGEGSYNCLSHGTVFPKSREIEDMAKGDFNNQCPICGQKVELISTDETSLISPISFYAYTKFAQEKMIEMMCPILDINYTIFRYQNVYGAGQSLNNPYTGILSIFSKLLLDDNPVNIFEDGLESRDFVHVSDVAEISCLALENDNSNSQIINIGTGENTSVIDVANILKDFYKSNSIIQISGDFRKGDIRHNRADITKLRTIFGCEPQLGFKKGISGFAKWVSDEYIRNQSDNASGNYENSINELINTGILIKGSKEL